MGDLWNEVCFIPCFPPNGGGATEPHRYRVHRLLDFRERRGTSSEKPLEAVPVWCIDGHRCLSPFRQTLCAPCPVHSSKRHGSSEPTENRLDSLRFNAD